MSYYISHRTEFRLPNDETGFSNPDHDPRGAWKADPFQVGGWRPNQQYEIVNPKTGRTYKPNPGCSWKNDYEHFKILLADNKIVFGKKGESGPQRKRFLSEAVERGRVAKTWWDDVETTTNGTQLLKKILGENVFDNPKPVSLIEKILLLATDKNSITLDSFAGSGTTAHAVLNLNAKDGGNRKFILVEMEDYAENITAERVRRVIQGYGQTAGTGGNFDFYEVGEPLMIHGNLNENIDTEKIRAYIWYTETHSPYKKPFSNNSAYLGEFNGTAIYFHYEREQRTILNAAFLRSIEQKADRYLIYADECSLSEDFLSRNSISFKKIPRDIKKLWSDETCF